MNDVVQEKYRGVTCIPNYEGNDNLNILNWYDKSGIGALLEEVAKFDYVVPWVWANRDLTKSELLEKL